MMQSLNGCHDEVLISAGGNNMHEKYIVPL